MSGGSNRAGKTPHKLPLAPSTLVTPSNKSQPSYTAAMETPNMSNYANNSSKNSNTNQYQHQGRQLYTPAHFTLAKNADLHMENRPDAFSPATIRMTDSLEKILTDDDDYVEAKQEARQRLLAQQHQQSQAQQQIIQSNDMTTTFGTYPKTQDSEFQHPRTQGAFRRIQSTGSSEDSADEEMEEMKDLDRTGSEGDDGLSEEEAEISQINEDLDDDEAKNDISAGRPRPLNFDGGPSSVVSASSSGAFKPAKRVVPTTTPKPQRTLPRRAAPTYPQPGTRSHHPNQGQGGGGMYYPQTTQQGYYGQSDGIMGGGGGHHMFNEHHQPPPPHLQYPQPHHQYPPQHHPSQNFHHPSMPSPQNAGFGLPHTGVVSPLTIPPDYAHGGAYPNSNAGSYPHHSGDGWWGGGPSGHHDNGATAGYEQGVMSQQHHGMHHPHDHLQQQQGMGGMIPPMPGHASPVDFDFHRMSGAASPFALPPHPSYPAPSSHHPAHVNNYSRHYHPHHSGGPEMYHSGVAGAPASARPRTRSREANNVRKPSPSTSSPTKQNQSSPGERRGMRPRKDSAASVNSGFASGGDEPGPSVFSQTASNSSSLRQSFPGVNASASSEEGLDYGDWFYPPSRQHGSGGSYDGGRREHKAYGQQQQPRAKKGSHDGILTVQNNSRLSTGERQGTKKPLMKSRDRQGPAHLDVSRQKPHGGGGEQGGEFLTESPNERQIFKEFGRTFRQKENESLSAARDYALACLDENNRDAYLPPNSHWRVYLELADVAKRSNQIDDARDYYRRACKLQPRASQGWLERSKLEEEGGNLKACAEILEEGLRHCATNENLLIRAVKFHERTGGLDRARQLLSRLKRLPIEKSWKTMLEGALLEARAGRYSMAREVLKFLTHNVPWYGPLYLAHTKLEQQFGSSSEAFSIVERGLKELPRYGPLYFQAFRLLEKEDLSRNAFDLPRTMEMVARADSISRELLWKVHLEAAQMQERAAALAVEHESPRRPNEPRAAALGATRRSYARAIMLCPPNLSWKVWLASGRTEVSCGNTKGARDLFLRAYDSVSEKGRSTVLLECARLEEYCGDLALSRSILCKARQQFGKSDWKVWLSSVNLECRCGLRERAIAFAQEALNIHRGTGRLWAALIQLRHDDGEMCQMKVLKCALQAVPKSGEVWCEGARIYLNPFSSTFDLQSGSRHLSFAARFTPQYGDSFLEQLRLNMIDQWLIPLATPFINDMQEAFLSRDQKMQTKDAYEFIAEHTKKAADVMKTQLKETNQVKNDVLDTSDLELRCSSADPNYGHLWFRVRGSPIDTAREVITQAKAVMANSVIDYSYLYIAAMVRRAGVIMLVHHRPESITASASGQSTQENVSSQSLPRPNSHKWDAMIDRQLRLAPPLNEMISESVEGSVLFTTGCVGNNHNWDKLSLAEKRQALFGSESLLS